MIRYVRRVLFFIALVGTYFIIRELVSLYVLMYQVHPYAGYATAVLLALCVLFFVVFPVYRILAIPRLPAPASTASREDATIRAKLQFMKNSPYLREAGYTFGGADTREQFAGAVAKLDERCAQVRRRYVSRLFLASAVSQNGFLDALLVLSQSVNLVKETFELYGGRATNRDLLTLGRLVYVSMVVGGSEGVEYVVEEVVTKLGGDTLKSIPFIDKIMGSIADGFVNAVLLTRVSITAQNYCKVTCVESDRDLCPSSSKVLSATRDITGDLMDKLKVAITETGRDKLIDMAVVAVNPIGYIVQKVADKVAPEDEDAPNKTRNIVVEGMKMAWFPGYMLGKLLTRAKRGAKTGSVSQT